MDQVSENPTTESIGNAPTTQDFTKGGKKGRIIIRNLVYDIHETHLRKLFSKYGEIVDISIPVDPTNNRTKGFAFVEFTNRNAAVKAIGELNGTKYKGREIILDNAVGKDKYIANKPQKEQKQDIEAEEENKQVDEEAIVEEVEEKPKKKKKKEEDLSKTVFVRNLPVDTSEEQLKEFFGKFGEVKYAKLVINKDTQESKGTAFVCFKNHDTTATLFDKQNSLENLYKQLKYQKNSDRKDELELLSSEFELEGRRVFIFEAMNKDGLPQTNTQTKVKPTKDIRQVKHLKQLIPYDTNGKRNLRLCVMGIFEPEEDMTQKEQTRREEHVRSKLQRLKNPNFFVSDKRIAMKGLPRIEGMEATLEQLVEDAMQFEQQQIKEGFKPCKVWISKDQDQITGLGFLDFFEPHHALAFMKYITRYREELIKKLHRLPIIEFAIEDVRKLRKIEQRRERQREMQIQKHQQKLEALNGKQPKSLKKKQSNLTNKLLIEEILKDSSKHTKENIDKIQQLWTELKSRGVKQRLKQKIERTVKIQLTMPPKGEQPQKQKEKQQNQQQPQKQSQQPISHKDKKEQKAEQKKQKQVQAEEPVEVKKQPKQKPAQTNDHKKMYEHFNQVMEDIKGQVMKKKREKQAAQEEDEVDRMAEQRLKKLKQRA